MLTAKEKSAFSVRLWSALKRSPTPIKGATDLARIFNFIHRAGNDISVQATHKWLSGHAIPTREKIKILADWLNVTEHWLHYGPPPALKQSNKKSAAAAVFHTFPTTETLLLAQKIDALPAHQKYIVSEFIKAFYEKK
jgi:hypothetical protein